MSSLPSFNSLQEVGFISTYIVPVARHVQVLFQFLTGSRFHFYGCSLGGCWSPCLCFNSLQEVGFISTQYEDGRRLLDDFGFNSLQEVGFISTENNYIERVIRKRQAGFNSLQEVGFISTGGHTRSAIELRYVSIPYRK